VKSIAIITARGGSKRIHRKNIKLFYGEPIISYSIKAAINSKLFTEIIVSTDDNEIAKIAVSYGAKVPVLRSYKNSNDDASTVDALLEVIAYYKSIDLYFDNACCIYPTAPFISSDVLLKAFRVFQTNKFDSLFPVLKYRYPIHRALVIDSSKRVSMLRSEYISTKSQDLIETYHDAGQFYWFDVAKFLYNKQLFSKNSGAIVLSEMQAHDIDELEDWEIALFKFRYLHET